LKKLYEQIKDIKKKLPSKEDAMNVLSNIPSLHPIANKFQMADRYVGYFEKAVDIYNRVEELQKNKKKYDDEKQEKSDAKATKTIGQLDAVNEDKRNEKFDEVNDKAKQNNAKRTGADASNTAENQEKKKKRGLAGMLDKVDWKDVAKKVVPFAISHLTSKLTGNGLLRTLAGMFQYQSLDDWKKTFGKLKDLGKKKNKKTGSIADNISDIKNTDNTVTSKSKKAERKEQRRREREERKKAREQNKKS